MKRLLSDINGVKTYMEVEGEKTHVTKTQDVEASINRNKALANHNGKDIRSEAYNHVATIPDIIIAKWRMEEGIDIFNPDHAEAVKKKLNDPEWRYLRTSELDV